MEGSDDLILGITCINNYTHDSSIAILKKNKILFATSEERYSRIKHDSAFPEQAIKGALAYLKLKPSSINTVAVGYPIRNPTSVLTHRYFFEIFPFTFSILVNRSIHLLTDLIKVLKLLYRKSVPNQKPKFLQDKKIIYIDHHLSHAASAYYTSGFNKCIAIVLDAFGSQLSGNIRSGAIFLCNEGQIQEVMTVPIYASLGLFYVAITYGLGFKPGDGEGKTMGLAPYGNPKFAYKALRVYSPSFKDGTWLRPQDWLAGILPSIPSIEYLFKYTRFGKVLDNLIQRYKKENVAAAGQAILEEELTKLIEYLLKKYPDYNNVCLSGGVFLNVKANKKIMELHGVNNIFIHPNAGDGGTAVGAAFIVSLMKKGKGKVGLPLLSCGLGESFSDSQILQILKQYKNKIIYSRQRNIVLYTAEQIIAGKVIGWFEGRSEWGPRALGFRSVLADPRKIEIKERINQVLKNREWFMPFAPSIPEEDGTKFFRYFRSSPFMTLTFDVIAGQEKLFPAALHIDNTARPNSVNIKNNPLYYKLLKAFYKKTGLPILLNTSFNKHGLPIVNSPKDAIDHLIMEAVDELIIGNYCVTRNVVR